MRSILSIVALLLLLGPAFAADGKAEVPKAPAKAQAKSKEEKPRVRTLQVKSGTLLFNVSIEPGVPDPGQVIAFSIELAEVPEVPDPIYGEKIPVKDAELTARVTDADGAGYTMAYRVHALQDAGSYGFHYTPVRKDNYRVALMGIHNGKGFKAELRVPVGIWPFIKVDAEGKVSKVPAQTASNRRPALPSGLKAPAIPGGAGVGRQPAARKNSPLGKAMQVLGEQFARAGVALFSGRRPDLKEAKAAADLLKAEVEKAAAIKQADDEYDGQMQELNQAVQELVRASGAGKAKSAKASFSRIGDQHCNRCHFKMRWKMIEQSSDFPARLP
jgi:hypothetical protein